MPGRGRNRAGRPEQARLAVLAAETAAALASTGDQAVLRAAGVAVSARARHTRSRHGWDSLTEAELRVVRLAARGHSNLDIASALYLSRRTVGWHLSNAFGKLGLASRTELAAVALQREAAGTAA